ncbi:hypothetical protein ACVWWO_006742 [Bradyrhizobium sp. F1.13.1]
MPACLELRQPTSSGPILVRQGSYETLSKPETPWVFHTASRRGPARRPISLRGRADRARRESGPGFRVDRAAPFPRARGRPAVALYFPRLRRSPNLAHPARHRHRHLAAGECCAGGGGCRGARSALQWSLRARCRHRRQSLGLCRLRPRQRPAQRDLCAQSGNRPHGADGQAARRWRHALSAAAAIGQPDLAGDVLRCGRRACR